MESHDSDQVFHSYLCKTQRRRVTRPDGSFDGWTIYDEEGVYTEYPVDASGAVITTAPTSVKGSAVSSVDDTGPST